MTVQRILDAKGKALRISRLRLRSRNFSNPSNFKTLMLWSSATTAVTWTIISEHDVIRGLREFGSDLLIRPVQDLMPAKVITCSPGDL